jgi:hypothetical protein
MRFVSILTPVLTDRVDGVTPIEGRFSMETVVEVVEVEGLGPVVPTSAILHILRGLAGTGVGGVMMDEMIDTVVGVEARCRMMRAPVRLVPVMPGRSICAHVETITYDEDDRGYFD